jgi:hypothetical protein
MMTDLKVRTAPHPNPLLGEEREKEAVPQRREEEEKGGKEFSSPLNGRG